MFSLMAASILVMAIAVAASGEKVATAQEEAASPNILYIVVDDADVENMNKAFPNTAAAVRDAGAEFTNFYVPESTCCPSRASLLLGEYPHNTGVESNDPPFGGWEVFRQRGQERRTIGVALQNLNYSTALIGKYLNGYESTSHVPPGWETWFGKWSQDFYNYRATLTNGRIKTYGSTNADHGDRVILSRARAGVAQETGPWFYHLSPTAPHKPAHDPPGDQALSVRFTPPPAYDEADVSDKPRYIQNEPRLSASAKDAIRKLHAARVRMSEHLDSRIAQLLNDLRSSGELENTYVVVTSDNGFEEGEHRRWDGKALPYEESSHVPLWIAGPGIAPGTTVNEPTSSVDLYATFQDMAGAATLDSRDGISLLPAAQRNGTIERQRILLEGVGGRANDYNGMIDVSHEGRKLKYIEYVTGEVELYDLDADPFELESLHNDEDPVLLAQLSAELAVLESCVGTSCTT
jgi:arylsulfatase A-like enzyme